MHRNPPIESYLLIILLVCLSLAGIYGGISLIIDSTGEQLHLNIEEYFNCPFRSFLFPGILLLFFFGIFPLLLVVPLVKKPGKDWPNVFNIYHRRHWSWTYTLFIGIFLIVWANLQIWMIGYHSFIQIFQSFYGLAIIFVCLLPEQINYSSKWRIHSDNKRN